MNLRNTTLANADRDEYPAISAHYQDCNALPGPACQATKRLSAHVALSFAGSCPNLQPDVSCGIYHRRLLACRIYPAEANTFVEIVPSNKKCPPEAWTPDRRSLLRHGEIIDTDFRDPISRSHVTAMSDVKAIGKLCAALGLDAASLINEGFVLYSPDPHVLLKELKRAEDESGRPAAVA